MTIDEFMRLNYRTELREKDGQFHFYLPELRLVASGGSVEQAYRQLRDLRRELFERHKASGNASDIPLPESAAGSACPKRAMAPFLLKAAVIGLIAVVLVVAAGVSITYTVPDTSPRKFAQKAGRAALQSFVSGLEDVAREGISEGRDKKIQELLRAAVPHLKPYADSLAPLFNCNAAQVPPGSS